MQIDPEAQLYSKTFDLEKENKEFQKKVKEYKEQTGRDLIVAKSDSKAQLQKLQDDLRKRGYRNLK